MKYFVLLISLLISGIFVLHAQEMPNIEFRFSYSNDELPFLGIVNGDRVNIRERADLKSRIIKKGKIGEKFFAVKIENGFYKIRLKPLRGWVARRYVSILPKQEGMMLNLGKINAKHVNIRTKPGLKSRVITRLNMDEELIVFNENEDYFEVEVKKENFGYLYREYLTPEKGSYYEVTTDRLNFRTGPSTRYKIISTLNTGEKVRILKHSGDFARILLSDERAGWVSTRYLKKIQGPSKTDNRLKILKLYRENNYSSLIPIAKKYIQAQSVPDKEIEATLIRAYYNTHDLGNFLSQCSTLKKQDPDYFEENLLPLENDIKNKLKHYEVYSKYGATAIASGDFGLNGVDDFVVLKKKDDKYYIEINELKQGLIPVSEEYALDFVPVKNYLKVMDLNADAHPEVLLKKKDGGIVAFSYEEKKFGKFNIPDGTRISDIEIDDRYSHKIYELKNNGIASLPFSFGSGEKFKSTSIDFKDPVFFNVFLGRDTPCFVVFNSKKLYFAEFGQDFRFDKIDIPADFNAADIRYLNAVDLDQDDESEILAIFGGNSPKIKIYQLKGLKLREIYSMDISASSAISADLDWNGKTDLLLIAHDSYFFILYDI